MPRHQTASGTAPGSSPTFADLEINGALNHDGSTAGFYDVAPVARPAAYTQSYATAARTHSVPAAAAVATTAATNVTPYGFNSAQANSIPVAINDLIADMANVKQVLNQVIDDLQAIGLLQ